MAREVRKMKVGRECHGGIEGLPLQLLIMVVIAGLGLTVILGWMNSISAPPSIGEVYVTPSEILVYDSDGDGLYSAEIAALVVTVTDQEGDRLEGGPVMLDGGKVQTSRGGGVRGRPDSPG